MNMKRIAKWLAITMVAAFTVAGITALVLTPQGVFPGTGGSGNSPVDLAKECPAKSITGLRLKAVAEEINIVPVEGDVIRVHLYGTAPGNQMPELEFSESGGVLTASVKQKPYIGLNLGTENLKMDVSVPRQYSGAVDAESVSGGLRLTGMTLNKLRLKTVSGKLAAETVSASEVTLESTSGEVTCVGLSSKSAAVSTTSGRLNLNGCTGPMTLKSVSGDVDVRYQAFRDALNVKTTSGHVTIQLPEKADFNLDYHSTSGDCDSDFPITLSRMGDTHQLQGKVGNGGESITVESVSGALEIRK